MIKLSCVGFEERAIELLTLVHTDVYGLFDVQTKDGYSYFIIFTDNLSWYGYMYLIKHKSQAFKKFKKFKNKVEK